MVLNKRVKILVNLLIIFFIFLPLNNLVIYDNYNDDRINKDLIIKEKFIIKSSGYWNLTGSPISINDSVPSKSWAYTALNYDWCTGSGTWNDPYIIENIIIDGQGSDVAIEITNSSKYFKVRNCTIFNSGIDWDNPVVKLAGVNNGFIINNNISNNFYNGILLSDSNNNTIFGNEFNNNSYIGIVLVDYCNNNNITKNIVESHSEGGIALAVNCNYNIVEENVLKYNYGSGMLSNGIYVYDSHYNTIKNNNISHCGGDNIYSAGIILRTSYFNTVSENNLKENEYFGLLITSSNENTISENFIEENKWNGVVLSNAHNNAILNNEINDNGLYGIGLASVPSCIDNEIVGNNVNNNNLSGIVLGHGCNFNLIANNTINRTIPGKFNIGYGNTIMSYGIILNEVTNTTVSNNLVVNHNASGIALLKASYNLIKDNVLDNNSVCGISLTESFQNRISKNIASRNKYGIGLNLSTTNTLIQNNLKVNNYGIAFNNCTDNLILENKVLNNVDGIVLSLSKKTDVFRNKIYNNSNTGILLYNNSKFNIIEGNRIKNNGNFGVNISSNENFLYNNYFFHNLQHAIDEGINNNWNNSDVGNYWDDYLGNDANNDGIGDIPYNISLIPLIQDLLPIWDENKPIIIIISPQTSEVFGVSAPTFIIEVVDHYVDTMWYSIDNGLTNVTFSENTTINQVLWDLLSEGKITIIFYANDTLGHNGYNLVIVIKSITKSPPNFLPIIIGVISGIGLASVAIILVVKKRLKPKD